MLDLIALFDVRGVTTGVVSFSALLDAADDDLFEGVAGIVASADAPAADARRVVIFADLVEDREPLARRSARSRALSAVLRSSEREARRLALLVLRAVSDGTRGGGGPIDPVPDPVAEARRRLGSATSVVVKLGREARRAGRAVAELGAVLRVTLFDDVIEDDDTVRGLLGDANELGPLVLVLALG